MPFTLTPLQIAFRTTARIAAFIPGASPPLVRTPIVFILAAIVPPVCRCGLDFNLKISKSVKPFFILIETGFLFNGFVKLTSALRFLLQTALPAALKAPRPHERSDSPQAASSRADFPHKSPRYPCRRKLRLPKAAFFLLLIGFHRRKLNPELFGGFRQTSARIHRSASRLCPPLRKHAPRRRTFSSSISLLPYCS